jgi:hypothetical protein
VAHADPADRREGAIRRDVRRLQSRGDCPRII